ncbi:MAG: cytochrome c maturation protein CcmE [Caldilinea sp.]|nr:cytochrome c maturation protein CcmE [Caldilinea sp.]MCB0057643.1 cytochrome c maturation protein CcmE [Caldilineaceae bacterium]MCB0040386.1 cytochrome c maturation protein CcmE [Caldilinea sp.]MCB0050409.1 cytochrome c maturation protein CcmE [Caldilinea sp.]MCB0134813.1 cytochrome c maturation protein CcmE [Caldilineaceae bacterium]
MTQLTTQAQAIPTDLAEKKSSSKNLKFVIGGLLLIGLVVALMVQATMSTGAYYMTVGELNSKGAGIVGERVRVSGTVVDGSEDWRPQEITLRFSIADENGAQLPIVFSGPRPDNFQRAASAIVEGELLPDGSFQAETLLLKCPSRYEEEPEEVFARASQ